MAGWRRPVGALLTVLGAVTFVLMVYGIVAWHPLCALLLFVWMAFLAVGLMLMLTPGKAAVPEPEPEPQKEAKDRYVPEDRGGFGSGYCPECGSPLADGDVFCGVCGRRL